MATVGDRIRVLREAKGLSQRELAARMGVGESTMSYYENTKNDMTFGRAVSFARFFNVSLDALAGLQDNTQDAELKQLRRENTRLKKELVRLRLMNLDICEEIRSILFPDPLMEKKP